MSGRTWPGLHGKWNALIWWGPGPFPRRFQKHETRIPRTLPLFKPDFGSVAEAVLRQAEVPVFLMRQTKAQVATRAAWEAVR